MCTINGKKKVNSRWVCSGCPQQPGLCSKECFKLYHPGYEILIAARPLNTTSAPDQPQQNQEPAQGPSQQPDEEAPVLYSAADWTLRVERLHILIIKPPTLKKKGS